MFSQKLWTANSEMAVASLTHPWVVALGSGALNLTSFTTYIAQDATFLLAFARAYGRVAGKCPHLQCIVKVHGLLGAAIDELRLHASYAPAEPLQATTNYVDFLFETSTSNSTALEVVAAMAPCMSLYAFIGGSFAPAGDDHPYKDWIDTYSSADFATAAKDVEGLLDMLAADADDQARERAATLYATAMRLEFEFFDAQESPGEDPAELQAALPYDEL